MTSSPAVKALDGLLSFPITPFTDGAVDVGRFRSHVRHQIDAGADAIFAACGTGEFFSLTPDELDLVVAEAVREAAGAVPVFSGVGYGTAIAVDLARRAARAGADGLLLLPPYLVAAEQGGLLQHIRTVAEATDLPMVPYQRDNAQFSVDTVVRLAALPTVAGLKDGVGRLDFLSFVRARLGDDFPIVNGLPTAEMSALPLSGIGVSGYSSAVLNFLPEVASAFRAALDAGGAQEAHRLLTGFFEPWVALRDEAKGFAVALVKAGVDLRYGGVGPVRPPLTEPDDSQRRRLSDLIDQGLALVA